MQERRTIRILNGGHADDGLPRLSWRLDSKAREVANRRVADLWDSSPEATIDREIVFTLEQLDRLRALHRELQRDLLKDECLVDTELMQMEARTPPYSPYRFPEREKLHRQIHGIHQEGRRLISSHAEQLRVLEDRLLSLLSKHAQLSFS